MNNTHMLKVDESFDTFRSKCYDHGDAGICCHEKATIKKCLDDKKYCPRIYKASRPEEKGWRNKGTGYDAYIALHDAGWSVLMTDKEWISKMENYHPDLDVLQSLNKAKDFWRSGDGWKHKLKSKSLEIDWEKTYRNTLDQPWNQVKKASSTKMWI